MPKADANITVGADVTAFSQTMDGLEKGIAKKMEKIGQVFMGAMGLAAAAKSIAGALSAFTAPAAELENVATSLGVVMGNAEAAERLTGSLRRLATNGVVGFDELHRSARALTNVFKDDAVISHYVSRLADIAVGADIPASRLAELVARMEDVGKAELTELANKGVPIFEALSEVMGKSRDEVVKMGNEGKVSCSAFLAALEKLTDEGGRYHQMNSKMSNTTKGSWDTLKESITECMEALGTPINDSIRPVLQDLAVWVQENKASIAAVGQGIVKVCTNVHTLTIGLGLLAATMRGRMVVGLCSMAASFKPVMASLRSFRMAAALTGSYWQATMMSMAVATRAAMTTIKASFASTLVGLGVVLIGEAVGWLYTMFSEGEDAAKDMEAAAEDAAAANLEALEASRREMELIEEAKRNEQERTQQKEEQARLAQEAADAEKERLKTVAEMARARQDAEFEREMDELREEDEVRGGGKRGVIRERLRRVGAPSEEALYAERNELERQRHMTEEQLRRYEQVAAAISKIEEEHRKAEEAENSHWKEKMRVRDDYFDRKSTYNRNREEEAYEKKSIPAQEKHLRRKAQDAGYWGDMNPEAIRARLDHLAWGNVEVNKHEIEVLERVLQLHDELVKRKERYEQLRRGDMQELRIQALELAGRKRAADALREELAIQQRITELRERGATQKQAEQQAQLESKMKKAQEQRQNIQAARVEFIQSHQASVGGGGVSFRLGDSQLKEARAQSKILKGIWNDVKALNKISGSVAVLA